MPKTFSRLVASLCIICCTFARAETLGSVSAVSQPVWLQLGEIQSELDRSNDISLDDKIVSGVRGRAEIRLWSDVILRLYPDSEILLRASGDADGQAPELYMQAGRLCLQSGPPSSTGRNFRLNVASRLLATIQQSAHICVVSRNDSLALSLLAGSVQLNNNIEPAIVILSEPGFELQLADDGSYQLLPPGSGGAIAGIDETPFISEVKRVTAGKADTGGKAEKADEQVADDAPPVAADRLDAVIDSATSAANDVWIYTVYLFSTRSEETARELNQKLQRAGHDTRIIVNTKGTDTHYRVAVSGFTTRLAAREYSESIVGTHGIRDTWIGRDKPAAAD